VVFGFYQEKGEKMKKWSIISLLLVVMCGPVVGCSTGGGDWQDNVPNLKADVFMFSKMATRLALKEADMPSEDVNLIKGYLVAMKDLLSVPGQPNFTGARQLVATELPQKYQVYGLTIIDLLDRYLGALDFNMTEDQELIIAIVSSGIDGALDGVQEFAG
jgi:hypothetical protein